jgi:hypothetical protein
MKITHSWWLENWNFFKTIVKIAYTYKNTVGPSYNNIGFCDTPSVVSDILWHQLIPHS